MAITATTPLDAIRVPAWAWALVAFALFVLLFAVQGNDIVLSASNAEWLHEITHDMRHTLGVPCH